MKKHERALRDAKRHVEDVKDDLQEEGLGEEEAGARVREAEAEVDSARRNVQKCQREFRKSLAQISRLSVSLFPELPLCMKPGHLSGKSEKWGSLALELFIHEPEVVLPVVIKGTGGARMPVTSGPSIARYLLEITEHKPVLPNGSAVTKAFQTLTDACTTLRTEWIDKNKTMTYRSMVQWISRLNNAEKEWQSSPGIAKHYYTPAEFKRIQDLPDTPEQQVNKFVQSRIREARDLHHIIQQKKKAEERAAASKNALGSAPATTLLAMRACLDARESLF